MKVKELLKVLTKETRVCISYTYNKGFDPEVDEIPQFVLDSEIIYVNPALPTWSEYDLVIHIDQNTYGAELEEYMEEKTNDTL